MIQLPQQIPRQQTMQLQQATLQKLPQQQILPQIQAEIITATETK